MSFADWFRALFAPPAKLIASAPIVKERPLYEQFQRIGGGLTPASVSAIIRQADAGQPAQLVDLANESRQKDGHLQGVLGTRDRAVALYDLEFAEPEDATDADLEAIALCRRIRDEFRNWPTLIEHLAGAYFHGHATAELVWERSDDGYVLPRFARPLHPRNFIFSTAEGALRYAQHPGDPIGIDLLAENPGRIIQIQRRVVGDVPVREGMSRVLIWLALFRNWDLRDWISLGEIGWKPWRIGEYTPGQHKDHVDALLRALERIGTTGTAAIPNTTKLRVEWPTGSGNAIGAGHQQLYELLGREISKAVLGQTTTTEAGPNGDRASTETRDRVRSDIREQDCRAVAAVLYWHLFMPAVALNVAKARTPGCYFQTEEGADLASFATMVNTLRTAGVRIPAKWVRDTVGMPEPEEGDELVDERRQRVEQARTLFFMSRAAGSTGYRVKNLPAIADEEFDLVIEEDLSLLDDGAGDEAGDGATEDAA